jgi:hypothetical protein
MKILNFIKYYYAWKVSRFNFFEGLNILGKARYGKQIKTEENEKELIRIEDFNPEHVNGLFNQFECEVIKSGKGYYFKLTIKEQVSSTSDYPLELKESLL